MNRKSIIGLILITLLVILVGVVINYRQIYRIISQPAQRNATQATENSTQASQNLSNIEQADALYKEYKYEEAFVYYQKAVQSKEDLAQAYAGLGNISMIWRRYDDAAGFFNQSLSYTNDPIVLAQRCTAYRLLANYSAAEQDCNSSIQLDPNIADGYAALAMLQLEENKPDAARETIDKAIQVQPNSSDLYYVSAQIYTKQGDLTNAINELSNCINDNPNQLRCYWERGFDYYMSGKIAEAKTDMNAILEKGNPEVDSELLYQAGNLLGMLNGK